MDCVPSKEKTHHLLPHQLWPPRTALCDRPSSISPPPQTKCQQPSHVSYLDSPSRCYLSRQPTLFIFNPSRQAFSSGAWASFLFPANCVLCSAVFSRAKFRSWFLSSSASSALHQPCLPLLPSQSTKPPNCPFLSAFWAILVSFR